jgi:cyclopropane-fatty-acyl-phospholipid synthase
MTSTAEYDPETNWDYWTIPKNKTIEGILRGYPGRRRRSKLLDRMLQQGHAEGIEFHYDVSNEFYRLFLDQDYMFYSCARFLSDDDTLEQAQKNKADFMVDLLAPEAGHQILDLGFGWGGMMRRIADETGTRDGLLGYTLSKQQLAYVRDLGFDVELQDFIEKDYKPESLDRVISIGSLEHVRPDEIFSFYTKIFRTLRSGGRMVNQFFSLDSEPFPASMVLAQLFFPGSVLAMHDVHVQAAERAGFVIKEDVKDSYKKTLRAWYDNLVSNRDKALATSGIHIYNEYMTFFPAAWRFFDDDESTLHRMLLVKP